jgi:hypothetical protein
VIGRSRLADIMVPEATVARRHAELVIADDGRFFLTDCGTSTGTWRWVEEPGGDGRWQTIRQAFVDADGPLRLGDHRCTARDLLRQVDGRDDAGEGRWRPAAAAEPAGRVRGRVERDPATGEIVRRRP